MRTSITARHMELTDGLKDHIEAGLHKLAEHYQGLTDANVVLNVEKHRHIAEVTLLGPNSLRIHGAETTEDLYTSFDKVVGKLDQQMRKHKTRMNKFKPVALGEADANFHHNIIELGEDTGDAAAGQANGQGAHNVVKREKLPLKHLTVEEAAMQLDLSGDVFLVFSNLATDQVNVIYAREDGAYGVIEPQF